ncbi:MAG: hypothetical protein PHV37_09100 [Candidatus Gastranaerophilales bacterium]|nr:hypothetical protein [Candidatus Gastranaerophilales bacterium]
MKEKVWVIFCIIGFISICVWLDTDIANIVIAFIQETGKTLLCSLVFLILFVCFPKLEKFVTRKK